jgi:hypothetical protein
MCSPLVCVPNLNLHSNVYHSKSDVFVQLLRIQRVVQMEEDMAKPKTGGADPRCPDHCGRAQWRDAGASWEFKLKSFRPNGEHRAGCYAHYLFGHAA